MNKLRPVESKYVNPSESQNYLREIWNNEEEIIKTIVPLLNNVNCSYPTDVFFFKVRKVINLL